MFTRYIKSLVILVLWLPTLCAADQELVDYQRLFKNTKEPKSAVLTKEDIELAQNDIIGKPMAAVFQNWTQSLQTLENICTPDIFQKLVEAFSEKPNEQILKSSLIYFRQKNWIDDVTLIPLLHYLPSHYELHASLSQFSKSDFIRTVYAPEDTEKKEPKNILVCVTADSNTNFSLLKYKNETVAQKYGRKYRHRHLVKALTQAESLAPIEAAAFPILVKYRYDEIKLTLEHVLKVKRWTTKFDLQTSDPNQVPTWIVQKPKKSKIISRRIHLYERFDDFQIQMLADLIEKFEAQKDANITIHVDYPEGSAWSDEVLNVSKGAEYRHIALILCNELTKLQNSHHFKGKGVITFDELVVAAFETGLLKPNGILESTKIEDVWNPPATSKEKWLKSISRFGIPLTLLIPPPYNYSTTILVGFLQGYLNEKKSEGPRGCLWYF